MFKMRNTQKKLDYGEKQWKTWKIIVRKLKIMENEKHTP